MLSEGHSLPSVLPTLVSESEAGILAHNGPLNLEDIFSANVARVPVIQHDPEVIDYIVSDPSDSGE